MNTRIYQEGGAADNMQQQLVALVQAAMQGDEKAQQTIQEIMQAAQQGDQQAQQIAQALQEIMQQMQGAQSAKYGAKLNYIHKLRTGVNRDEEIVYQKCGGKMSKKIVKKQNGDAFTDVEEENTKRPQKVYF